MSVLPLCIGRARYVYAALAGRIVCKKTEHAFDDVGDALHPAWKQADRQMIMKKRNAVLENRVITIKVGK